MTEVTRKKLRELAGEDRFIPGIYNYCDRWCARCLFNTRCLNYAAVIRWYQFFIHVELQTALLHAQEEPHPLLADEPRVSDGEAKIALIAIDRSLDAWDTLGRMFPQRETETLEILRIWIGCAGPLKPSSRRRELSSGPGSMSLTRGPK